MLYPLPSFAMWTAFPSSDYYEGSAPAVVFAGRFGHPVFESEVMARFLGSVSDLSLAVGADCTPCGIWPRTPQARIMAGASGRGTRP